MARSLLCVWMLFGPGGLPSDFCSLTLGGRDIPEFTVAGALLLQIGRFAELPLNISTEGMHKAHIPLSEQG